MRILFQGDSITDAGRFDDPEDLGYGYPRYTADLIRSLHPENDFEFINKGISGNRVTDLVARWTEDCIDLQPDVVSILIGINDTWHAVENVVPRKTPEEFEGYYREILTRTKNETKARIIILEPFTVYHENIDSAFRDDLWPKIGVTRKLAREFADAYIPLDGIFAEHVVGRGRCPDLWSGDGVHPSENGSKLIAQYYLKAFDTVYYSII